MNYAAVLAWLLDAGTIIAFALLAACAAYGMLLVLVPRAARRATGALNRRYSSRRALRPLEIPRRSERWFYRHHRLTGAVLLACVIGFFLLYVFHYPRDSVVAVISGKLGALTGALVDAAEWFLVAANALIGVFSLAMLVRPSLLKPLESWANRWVSTRQVLRGAESSHEPLDRFTDRHPRAAGLLILAGTGYVALSLLLIAG